MKNSINTVIPGNYRKWAILSLIIVCVSLSGMILFLSILNNNQPNGNNQPNHDGEPSSAVFDGLNLFVLREKNQDDRSSSLKLLITDMKGNVIIEKEYLKKPGGLDNYSVEFFNTTTVLLGDDDKRAVLWNFVTNTTVDLGFRGHHDLEYNANNDTFFTMNWFPITIGEFAYGRDWIREFDWQGNRLWSLDTMSFISPEMWCPFNDSYVGPVRDLTHGNTVFYDSEEDVVYYNTRNCNTFYKIDHKTKEVIWGLGEYGNFSLFDERGNPREHLFFHTHSVEKIDANTFILFDNDMHNQTNPENQRSRIVEITIDETTMSAYESWSWTAPIEYYSNIWCDADRLPNGNRLGTFGTDTHPNTDIGARLVEVNDTGHIVWELNYPPNGDYIYGIYRMERFRFTPTISSPPDVWVLPKDDVSISWQTWYNFRTKHPVNGSYSVYLDEILIEKGNHTFDKWWLPSNLTVSLDSLPRGTHNMTIILADETGSETSDNVTIHVTTSPHVARDSQKVSEIHTSRPEARWSVATTCALVSKSKNKGRPFLS